MSSKFFASSESSSDLEDQGQDRINKPFGFFALDDGEATESSYESSSESEISEVSLHAPKKSGFFDISSSEEEEETGLKKAVKSQEQKTRDELHNLIESIDQVLFEKKWIETNNLFDVLLKKISRSTDPEIVDSFNKLLLDIDDDLNNKEACSSVMKLEAKAMFALKQKIRRIKSDIELKTKSRLQLSNLVKEKEEKESEVTRRPVHVKRELSQIAVTSESVLEIISYLKGSKNKKHNVRVHGIPMLRKAYEICLSEEKKLLSLFVLYNILLFELETFSGNSTLLISIVDDFITFSDKFNIEFFECKFIDDFNEINPSEIERDLNYLVVSRIRDELFKSFTHIDPHSNEYFELLLASERYVHAIEVLLGKINHESPLFYSICLLFLELIHSHPNLDYFQSSLSYIHCIYRAGDHYQKIECSLYHIFMLARAQKYYPARNLWQHLRIYENLPDGNMKMNVYYNRTLAILGIAAFCSGEIKDCYFLLQELCSSGKPKDLLGQQSGMQLSVGSYCLPFHFHINVEILDAFFSISSVILESPQISLMNLVSQTNYQFDFKRNFVFHCRHLRRLLDSYDKNIFNGPPENTRESIISAAKFLLAGDSQSSLKRISSLRIWKMVKFHTFILRNIEQNFIEAHRIISKINDLWSSKNSPDVSIFFDLPNFDIKTFQTRGIDFIRTFLYKLSDSSNFFSGSDIKDLVF